MQEVLDFLKKCETYYLATIENNQPRVRPFGTIELFENKLYFLTGRSKDIAKQLTLNPQIEICAYDGDVWLRVRAAATEDNRREAKKHMLDAYPFLRSTYSEDDDNTLLLYLQDGEALFSNFGGVVKTVKL